VQANKQTKSVTFSHDSLPVLHVPCLSDAVMLPTSQLNAKAWQQHDHSLPVSAYRTTPNYTVEALGKPRCTRPGTVLSKWTVNPSFDCSQPFCSRFRCPWRSVRTQDEEATIIVNQAFCVAGPVAWNSLPLDILFRTYIIDFQKKCSRHLFSRSYFTD